MSSFSINPSEPEIPVLTQYTRYLTEEVFRMMPCENDIEDPFFLQKLSVLQAEGIRQAVNRNTAVACAGVASVNETVRNATGTLAGRINYAAGMVTSSLENGFASMNYNLAGIGGRLDVSNSHLANISAGVAGTNARLDVANRHLGDVSCRLGIANRQLSAVSNKLDVANTYLGGLNTGVEMANRNLQALGQICSEGFGMMSYALTQVSNQLEAILDELRIPESQRERRYHIEEGLKYLGAAIREKDDGYFEDAMEEFKEAVAIERKDYFSWYNIGLIHLFSKDFLDIDEAIKAFGKYLHYAKALPGKKHNLWHDAHLHLAECHYLQAHYDEADQCVLQVAGESTKAAIRHIKYLSVLGGEANNAEAVKVLAKLLDEKPYTVLQVLDDADILRNDAVLSFLEEERKKKIEEAKTALEEARACSYVPRAKIEECERLLAAQTYLEAMRALEALVEEANPFAELGLSVKWAKCNLSVDKPEEYGDYYAWGETSTKSSYDIYNSMTYRKTLAQLKSSGIVDANNNLTANYDVAQKLGKGRMPTLAEIKELKEKCTWEWIMQNGKNGYRVTGPNGRSIFLPAAGGHGSSSRGNVGLFGYYWTSTADDYIYRAYKLSFYSDYYDWGTSNRCLGRTIRPVSDK